MLDGLFEQTTIAQCNRETWFVKTRLTQPQLQKLITGFQQESAIAFHIAGILDSGNINNESLINSFDCEGEAVHRLIDRYREAVNQLP